VRFGMGRGFHGPLRDFVFALRSNAYFV
jgi:hypothetical protein